MKRTKALYCTPSDLEHLRGVAENLGGEDSLHVRMAKDVLLLHRLGEAYNKWLKIKSKYDSYKYDSMKGEGLPENWNEISDSQFDAQQEFYKILHELQDCQSCYGEGHHLNWNPEPPTIPCPACKKEEYDQFIASQRSVGSDNTSSS